MTDFIKQLKEQINVAEVVGEYVRLKKTGSNHMGLCPFHAERSPSFSVSEKKGIYHCFGCQRGGDAISFVQEIQAVSFHEAVRILCSKYGIKIPAEFSSKSAQRNEKNEDKFEIYYKLNRFVAQFYHEKLLGSEGKEARDYLKRRGILDSTVKTAYLGYASAEWAELHDFLKSKKAPLDRAEELGLIRRKATGADASGRLHYDLFRDRVLFPVTDTKGRVVAFGGRALHDTDGPKYLNSTESPVFKKGSQLFGLFFAQKDIRAEDTCVVVEGFMDCISLQQAGIGYTVATLGTALSEKQVAVLKRFTKNIVLLFDGDSAGKEAQARAMEVFLNEDLVVRGVSLPDGLDPDEFVQERGVDELKALIKNAPYLLDQRILELASQAGAHSEERARAVDQVLPWVAKISSDTARLVRLQELAGLFDVGFEALNRRLGELLPQTQKRPQTQPAPAIRHLLKARPAAGVPLLDPLDVRVVECLVRYPELFSQMTDFDGILSGLESEVAKSLVESLIKELKSKLDWDAVGLLDRVGGTVFRPIVTRALLSAEEDHSKVLNEEERQDLVRELGDLERKLVRRGLERRKERLRAVLLKADGSGETNEYKRLMNEYNELVKRLDETKGGQVNL
ncbi:MAG: DNA primase [Bdellovibrionota bacterium]